MSVIFDVLYCRRFVFRRFVRFDVLWDSTFCNSVFCNSAFCNSAFWNLMFWNSAFCNSAFGNSTFCSTIHFPFPSKVYTLFFDNHRVGIVSSTILVFKLIFFTLWCFRVDHRGTVLYVEKGYIFKVYYAQYLVENGWHF